MILLYNGKDVTDSIGINSCQMRDGAGGEADMLIATFTDNEGVWSGWNPQRDDTIEIKTGKFDSGNLFVHSISYPDGLCTVQGVSVPRSAYKPRSKIWRDVTLLEVAGDVAARSGLILKNYGISNWTYEALSQINASDLQFLSWLCQREGYAVKVSGGKLVIFGEKYMENISPTVTINQDEAEPTAEFLTGKAYASMTVKGCVFGKGVFSATARDSNGIGDAVIEELVRTKSEAERWSAGRLRSANKHRRTARIPMRQITDIAAGSTVALKGFGSGHDGSWFVESIIQDSINERSTLTLRTPLGF